MQKIIVFLVFMFVLTLAIDRLFEAPPYTPMEPTSRMVSTLDKLIARSMERQREINDGLDKAIELNRRATNELRSFRHNP